MNLYKDDSRLLRKCHASCLKIFGCKRRLTKEWSNDQGMSWIQIDEVNTCGCCPYEKDPGTCELKKTIKKVSHDAYCPDCLNRKLSQRRD